MDTLKEIISKRLKQFRLANGLSLDELVAKSGGIVSKQAISKYERGLSQPSARVLTKISLALGIKAVELCVEPQIKVNFVAYRKYADLRETEQRKIQNFVSLALEKRVKLQKLLRHKEVCNVPIQAIPIRKEADAEEAAMEMREKWKLGMAPISSAVDVLEENCVHVLEIDSNTRFDGISAVAYENASNKVDAAAVVVRRGLVGERQRLNLIHELGHIVLKVSKGVDEERSAFRFGAAFLAPRDLLVKEVGARRSFLSIDELLLLKKRFGISMQALMFRLKELEIINQSFYARWFRTISCRGWRKQEPEPLVAEHPEWLKLNVLKAYAEGVLSHRESEAMLNEKIENNRSLKLVQMKSFLKLPLPERARILKEQAQTASLSYKGFTKGKDLVNSEFHNYGYKN